MKGHPVFARVWDMVVRVGGRPEREHRRELVGGVRGRVLEFGAGTGLNFELYPKQARVVAVEPEPTMARRASQRAGGARAAVWVLRASAEALPFKEAVFDVAVSCYVLCTIPDPGLALGEVQRVLAPNGQLRFYEHVRSAHPRWARWQDRLTPAWRFIGAGCHPNRETLSTIREAGFQADARRFSLGPPSPVRSHLQGVARTGRR